MPYIRGCVRGLITIPTNCRILKRKKFFKKTCSYGLVENTLFTNTNTTTKMFGCRAKKTREAERANAVRDKFEIENRLKTLNGESAAVEETSYSLHR